MYDKEILKIVIYCTLLFTLMAFSLIIFVIRYKNKSQQHDLEKQRLLFELEKKELNMGFRERELVLSEVSKDMHDNIGQLVYLIRMNVCTIEEYSNNADQLPLIKDVLELTDRVIEETKYLGHSLNSDFIKGRGLYRMLENDMERINVSKKLNCYMDIEGDGDDHMLTAEAQLLVYRIAQEAIHNVLRHAHASNLQIMLAYNREQFRMVISDDGDGFDVELAKEKETMGISNMQQRAKLLNGNLELKSSLLNGCFISLSFKGNNAQLL